jgi:hypothetical protein
VCSRFAGIFAVTAGFAGVFEAAGFAGIFAAAASKDGGPIALTI